ALNAESWRILLAPLISPSRLPTATSFSVSAEQSWATARAAAVASSICAHSTVATLAKQASRASYASWILGVCQRSPTLKKLPSHALSSNTCDDSSTRDAKADRMRGPRRKRVHQACMVGCVQTESADNLAQPRLLHFARPKPGRRLLYEPIQQCIPPRIRKGGLAAIFQAASGSSPPSWAIRC